MAKKAGLAATESILRSLMPELADQLQQMRSALEDRLIHIDRRLSRMESRLDSLEDRMAGHERRLEGLKSEMIQLIELRYQGLVEAIGEIAQRVSRFEGVCATLNQTMSRQTDRMELWIERTVRVETLQEQQTPARKRKAI